MNGVRNISIANAPFQKNTQIRKSFHKNRASLLILDILDLVRQHRLVSRSQLSELTGMSRSSTGQYVDELIQLGLLEEGPEGESTGGRRSQLLRLSHSWGYVAGVDMGATSVDIGLCNLSSEIVDTASFPINMSEGPAKVLSQIVQCVQSLVNRNGNQRLVGVGLGVPGPVNRKVGAVDSPPIMPGWDGFPISQWVGDRLKCRVYVDNDVNVMALGEQAVGDGQGVRDFVFVKVGTGIGAGIIAGGALQRGVNGCAGDMGHINVTEEPVPCACGRLGCLEAVASGTAIGRIAQEAAAQRANTSLARLLSQEGQVTAKDVGDLASRGDRQALDIVRQAGKHLGQALSTVVNCLNPSMIILAGGVLNMGDLYLAAVREYVYKRSLPLATRNLKIVRSSMGNTVGMIGAATLVIDELFSLENYSLLQEASEGMQDSRIV